ncbi:MAG TPA: DUF1877 family protein [Candidatus Angelobacter sp.]|nr:DUF1877 family protein [Candidatus Angelobacter sp.]
MGISLGILTATDEEIRGFASDAEGLRALFRGITRRRNACLLHDFWDAIDFVLTAEAGAELPFGALKRGDVRYPNADDSTHAIFAATTKALARELSALPESALRRRFDPPKMLAGVAGQMVYPGRLWNPAFADSTFLELMHYFERLRAFAAAAAAADLGLVFCRYEDL